MTKSFPKFLCIVILVFNWCSVRGQIFSAGSFHSIFLCSTKPVLTCGSNKHGELGLGSAGSIQTTPVPVSDLTNIVAIETGMWHSIFIRNDGVVYATGENMNGQLGDSTTTSKSAPVLIKGLERIVASSAGAFHSLFLRDDGRVFSCGSNLSGQLGDGSSVNHISPVMLTTIDSIIAISAGTSHSLFLRKDGSVWACGQNSYSSLGDSTNLVRPTPFKVKGLSNIRQISGGAWFSLFLKNDGTVWGCGDNGKGQLCDSETVKKVPVQLKLKNEIIAIAAGGEHSLFLTKDRTVLACGYNYNGQLGNGTRSDNKVPMPVTGLGNVQGLSASGGVSMFLVEDKIWACGANDYGQFGDGTTKDHTTVAEIALGCSVTKIKENEAGNSLEVFPNPFLNELNIRWSMGNSLPGILKIYDISGMMVFEGKCTGAVTSFDLSSLEPGMYFLQASSKEFISLTYKIVK
jgi:alpha-tubulin suppressor-like RCC1 family protein